MSLNKTFLADISFSLKKSSNISEPHIQRVFEKVPHNIPQLKDVNFCSVDNKKLHSIVNKGNANLSDDSAFNDDIYLTLASSQVYSYLMNFVRVPTQNTSNAETCCIRICVLKLKNSDDFIKNRGLLNFLGFINVGFDEKFVLFDVVYDYLRINFDDLILVSVVDEFTIHSKRIVVDRIENDVDILSSSRQSNYRTIGHSILYYKTLNKDSTNSEMLDNLQSYVIDQQIRFCVYLTMKPILVEMCVGFFTQKNIVDVSGNLFFKLNSPLKPLVGDKTPALRDVLLAVLDFGFFISYPNLEDNISFDNGNNTPPQPQKSNEYTERYQLSKSLGENPIYSILFRLMDANIYECQHKIDDLILTGDYAGLQKLLTEIIE